MAERIWDKILTDRDKQVFATSGYGAEAGGGKKPALLVIDVNYAFCGERSEPILDPIKKWRTSCGEDAWEALPHIRKLIDKCHAKGIPVIYTTGTIREDGWDKGSWAWKSSRSNEDFATAASDARDTNRDGNDIMTLNCEVPDDLRLTKLADFGAKVMQTIQATCKVKGEVKLVALIDTI